MKCFIRLAVILSVGIQAACTSTPVTLPKAVVSEIPVKQHETNGFPDKIMQGRVLYLQCTGGYEFSAHIQRDEAWVFLPEGTKRLVPEQSTAGYRYSNGEYSLWVNKNEAMLDVEGLAIKQCRNNQKKAVWEEAKLRGADFRAVGNNLDWSLELSLDGNTVFIADKGTTRALFKTTEPVIDAGKRTSTYHMNNGEQKMTVHIEGLSCNDSVNGELFDTTVTVNLEGRSMKGCGRALQ